MHYSIPQKIVETLRAMPEYQDLLQRLRDKGVDVDQIIELLRALFGLSRKGNVFNDCKHNGNSLCFVLTRIRLHDL
jgi:hypothetical protein